MQRLWINEESLYESDTMPAVVAASIFGSQGGSLLSLSVLVPTVSLDGNGIAALAALTRLTHLEVRLALFITATAELIDVGTQCRGWSEVIWLTALHTHDVVVEIVQVWRVWYC